MQESPRSSDWGLSCFFISDDIQGINFNDFVPVSTIADRPQITALEEIQVAQMADLKNRVGHSYLSGFIGITQIDLIMPS